MSARAGRAAAAARIGVSLDEYDRRRAEGQRWCVRCKAWHPAEAFGVDGQPNRDRRRVCNVGPWRT